MKVVLVKMTKWLEVQWKDNCPCEHKNVEVMMVPAYWRCLEALWQHLALQLFLEQLTQSFCVSSSCDVFCVDQHSTPLGTVLVLFISGAVDTVTLRICD